MRRSVLAFSFCALLVPAAAAQQVTLLESAPLDTAPAADTGTAHIIQPSKTAAPAPAAVKVSTITARAVKAAARPAKKKARTLPAVNISTKTAAVKPAAARPAAAQPAAAKPAAVKPAKAHKAAARRPARIPPPETSTVTTGGFAVDRRHKVSGGDTLWDLSGKYYGNPYKWGKIYNANVNTVANPDRIYPKEELIIPGITDEVKPAALKPAQVKAAEPSASDTVTRGEFSSSDETTTADAEAVPVVSEPVSPVVRINVQGDDLAVYERNDLSSEMPVDQKEWSSFMKVVPDDWVDDGVVFSKTKTDTESVEDGLSFTGELVSIRMRPGVEVKKGDFLTVYIKGAPAFDKKGVRLGREIQPAGVVEVLGVEGDMVKARVRDASSVINKGLVVKVTVRS